MSFGLEGNSVFFVVRGRERESHFFNPKQPINLSSLLGSPPPPGEWRGWGGVELCVCVCVGGGADTQALVFLCLFRSHLDPSPLTSPSIGSFVASKVSPSLRLPPVVL